MYVVFILLTVLVSCILEFYLGAWRIMLPLAANAVFYFTIAESWKGGLTAAVCGGLLLDLAWARGGFFTAVALVLLMMAARVWARQHWEAPLAANMLPGALIPAFIALSAGLAGGLCGAETATRLSWGLGSDLLLSGVVNAVILPATIAVLDLAAGALDFDRFSQSFERRKREAEEA